MMSSMSYEFGMISRAPLATLAQLRSAGGETPAKSTLDAEEGSEEAMAAHGYFKGVAMQGWLALLTSSTFTRLGGCLTKIYHVG